jgi:hypothetical protein
VLPLVTGHQPPRRGDHPPPRHGFVGHAQEVANGACGAGEASFCGHVAVGHDLSGYESPEHGEDPRLERRHPRSLSMEDVPEADALEQSQPVDPRLDEPEIEKS